MIENKELSSVVNNKDVFNSVFHPCLANGFKPSSSSLLAGMSKAGLSSFVDNIIYHIASKNQVQVIHYCNNRPPIKRKLDLIKVDGGLYAEETINKLNIIHNDSNDSCNKMLTTCLDIQKNTDLQCIVVIEDLFTVRKDNEKNDFDLSDSLVILINTLKKHNFYVLATNRFNGEIEKDIRVQNNRFHYPVTSDIYNSHYILNAFNRVYSFHQPKLLNIKNYGVAGQDTKNLIHIRLLRANEAKMEDVWLNSVLENRQFIEQGNEINV